MLFINNYNQQIHGVYFARSLPQGAVAALRRNDMVSAAGAALDGALAKISLDGALAKISGTQQTKEAVAWPGEVAYYDSGDDDHVYR